MTRQQDLVMFSTIEDVHYGHTSKKPRVYVSGPMTGVKDHNLPAFAEAAKMLRNLGFEVFNPGENFTHDSFTWETYMKWDLIHLLNCDLIYMLPDWEGSRGARMEKYVADEMKIPELTIGNIRHVYYEVHDKKLEE